MEFLEKALEWGGTKRKIVFLIISAIALIFNFFKPIDLPFDPIWIAIVLCGLPIVLEAIVGLVTNFDIKADVLVSIALLAALFIGEYFAAGEVAFIMQLGALLEELTVERARAGIERLVCLTPQTARVVTGGGESIVSADEVQKGDLLRVLPGETVPVDGFIVTGQTSVDESVMTGESMPIDKAMGDEVRSGTVNCFGVFEMQAVRVGEDSALQRMIALVRSADAGKARIVRLADRWATWIVVIALAAAVLTFLVTGEIIRSVTVLVVFCPCALVLATPTAVMAAIGNVTRFGILVREGDALERIAQIKRMAFDKTGTITYGKPTVVAVGSFDARLTDQELFSYVVAAENMSEHPLGKAMVAYWREAYDAPFESAADFVMMPGRGVQALVAGRTVYAGNKEMMAERGIEGFDERATAPYVSQGATIVLIALDGKASGFIAMADRIREDAASTIESMKRIGIIPVLITGDSLLAARHIAQQVGIEEVEADCLPERKLEIIDGYQAAGEQVCMVGDGVNDAPALRKAFAGVAMGGIGSDIAVEAADIALVQDDISALPFMVALSRRMMTTIKLNMTCSMVLNFVAIGLAMGGILDPVTGALVHNVGSVLVIVNSATLLRWRMRRGQAQKGNAGEQCMPAMRDAA